MLKNLLIIILCIILTCKASFSAKITNCNNCNSSDESASVVLENTKTDEEVCKFSKYSAAFKKEVVKRNLDCNNIKISKSSDKKNKYQFARDLKAKSGFGSKIVPNDPFFYVRSFEIRCKNIKTNKSSYRPMIGFINKNYLYASYQTRDQVLLAVGYKTNNNKKFKVESIDMYFPTNEIDKRNFEMDFEDNIIENLKKGIKGNHIDNPYNSCTFKLPMLTSAVFPSYNGNNVEDKKYGLERAINALKSFEQKQYDINSFLIKKGTNLDFKFELTDIISDLSIKMTVLDIKQNDKETKRLAEQRARELEEERTRLKVMEIERKRLEEKTKQLAEQNRIAKLNAKKKSEEIAKEVAAQEREKLEEERALRRAEEKARKNAQEKAKQLEAERLKAEKIAEQLLKERKIAEQKAKDLEQTQLASLQKEKEKREQLIQNEKKKRELLEKKLATLQEENKRKLNNNSYISKIKLPPEWVPFKNKMSLQQEQFCQLTNRFFDDIETATKSGNEIKVNIVHKERQENLDGLLPKGKVNNWIFKIVKIDQVEDGSAAVVLSLQCKSFVGSGQIHTRSTWRKKSSKEWRATIPYDDRRFRELAKLDKGQFILGSGVMLEINAFKPGQKETFYASQQIGDHPLTKGLNLEGELFIADLSYIAALN